jgi:electron transfer flavoprotein alpha subunit
MKIVVCVKQVPNLSAIRFDPAKSTIVREGVPLEVSSFDIRALLAAVELAKKDGAEGEVVALTMGPPQAAQALRHCLALGADHAVHLCDPEFAGADTLATAHALAAAIEREGADLVFCGRFSVDAETAQVGPELAELLGWPQATAARSVCLTSDRARALVVRETDEGTETLDIPLPFVITATEDIAPERFPARKDRDAAKAKPAVTLTAADLGGDLGRFGARGSPTSVREIVTLEAKRRCRFVSGVDELVSALREEGLFGTWKRPHPAAPVLLPPDRTLRADRSILVVAEVLGGHVRHVTLELLGKASELAAKLGGEVATIAIGHDVARHAATLAAHGADRILVAEGAHLAPFAVEPHAEIVTRVLAERGPHSVLFGSTSVGRDLAPRVAARLDLGLTSDCLDLAIDGDGNLVQHKPAFGGNIVAPILSRTFPQMATVRPGILQAARADPRRRAHVVAVPAATADARARVVSASRDAGAEAVDLDEAEVVVGFGMGVGGPENLGPIRELARVLGAPLATTRDCCDKGWLPRQHQVGLTGRAIAPRLYFAIGIRGAFEHTVGIGKAGLVVAINSDHRALIWECSDLGLEDDWNSVVPALSAALSR